MPCGHSQRVWLPHAGQVRPPSGAGVVLALSASREAGEEIRRLPEPRAPAINLHALGGRVGAYYARNISAPGSPASQQENPRKRGLSAAGASEGAIGGGGGAAAAAAEEAGVRGIP